MFLLRAEHSERFSHLPSINSLTCQEECVCRGRWTVAKQSLPHQESSCDYCNANLPVITLRACRGTDGELWEPPFSSMWPHSWQQSHPVTGPQLNSFQQESADWDIYPPAIVPLIIPSKKICSIWFFFFFFFFLKSYCENKTRRSDYFLKENTFSVFRVHSFSAATNNYKIIVSTYDSSGYK